MTNAEFITELGFNIYIITCIIGNILYVLLQGFLDYLLYRNHKDKPLIKNKKYNYLFSGFIYLVSIQLGIISSNCLYYLTVDYSYGYL